MKQLKTMCFPQVELLSSSTVHVFMQEVQVDQQEDYRDTEVCSLDELCHQQLW